ncbi:uncharacterized protein LOC112140549 [Oryzias melastigma]|uniref:uncharacterized protein LOC112140549 n=1 Tax=Oryzias melastigma TaxID=30732 RepID=UPI000CF7D5AB|nr:uncharacterized protein LOC112140549 [Oryzias melastigma]
MAKFNPPESFDFTQPSAWPAWRQRFSRYRIATKLDHEAGEVQVNTLLYAMGKEAEPIFSTFTYTDDDDEDYYEAVVRQFDEHFVPKRNTIHERACFHRRSQRPGETVEAFVRHLYELAEHCDFGTTKDEQIRDRIVIGILDNDISQKLQLEPDLTLENAIKMARQSELIKMQNAGSRDLESEVNAVSQQFKQFRPYGREHVKSKRFQHHRGIPKAALEDNCSRCGRTHERGVCPAKGKRCRKCNKTGHFEMVCKSKFVGAVENDYAVKDESSEWFLGSISTDVDSEDEKWFADIHVNGTVVRFRIDTGADITVISENTYHNLPKRPSLEETKATFTSPGGKMVCKGRFHAECFRKGDKYTFWIYVMEGPFPTNLMGRKQAVEMGLVLRMDGLELSEDVFGDIGLLHCSPVKIESSRLIQRLIAYLLRVTSLSPFCLKLKRS